MARSLAALLALTSACGPTPVRTAEPEAVSPVLSSAPSAGPEDEVGFVGVELFDPEDGTGGGWTWLARDGCTVRTAFEASGPTPYHRAEGRCFDEVATGAWFEQVARLASEGLDEVPARAAPERRVHTLNIVKADGSRWRPAVSWRRLADRAVRVLYDMERPPRPSTEATIRLAVWQPAERAYHHGEPDYSAVLGMDGWSCRRAQEPEASGPRRSMGGGAYRSAVARLLAHGSTDIELDLHDDSQCWLRRGDERLSASVSALLSTLAPECELSCRTASVGEAAL